MRAPATVFALALLLWAAPAFGESELEGKVTVRCPVVGATVLVDDQPVGIVPLAPFDLKFGSHIVSVKKEGLISFEQQIRLRTGQHVVIDAVPAQARALLTIDAGLTGGEVLLDDKPVGALPIEKRSIAPGRHTLLIRTPGHEPAQMTFVAPPHEESVVRPAFVTAVPQGAVSEIEEDLDLELELELPPASVRVAEKPVAPEEDFASLPDLEALTARDSVAPSSTFVVDPIALEETTSQPAPSTPIYKKGWFWAATGAVAVAAVAIPVLAGGGYQEVRDPSTACADCLAVLNR